MFNKVLETLKKNPIITIFYVVYLVILVAFVFLMQPGSVDTKDPIQALAYAGKMMLWSLVMGLIGVLYFSGFGNMLAEAVKAGTTSAGSFLPGLKKFIGRLVLAGLLALVFVIGFSIAISILTAPIAIFSAAKSGGDLSVASSMGVMISLIYNLVLIFLIPFVMLWYPAMFIDDVGVIEGLKRGAKAGVKSYWALVAAALVMVLPTIIYTIVNKSNIGKVGSQFNSPDYWINTVAGFIISIFIILFIFIVYREKSPESVGETVEPQSGIE